MKDLLGFLVLVTATVLTAAQGTGNITCSLPFQNIGDRCLYVDPLESGTWYDMRLFCSLQGSGGDLAQINDAELLRAVYEYITKYGLDRSHYWVGASDADTEGLWLWQDSSPVRMGAPFWRYDCDELYPLRPQVNPNANCAALDQLAHFLFADFPCLGDGGNLPFSPICEGDPVYLDEYDEEYYDDFDKFEEDEDEDDE